MINFPSVIIMELSQVEIRWLVSTVSVAFAVLVLHAIRDAISGQQVIPVTFHVAWGADKDYQRQITY